MADAGLVIFTAWAASPWIQRATFIPARLLKESAYRSLSTEAQARHQVRTDSRGICSECRLQPGFSLATKSPAEAGTLNAMKGKIKCESVIFISARSLW